MQTTRPSRRLLRAAQVVQQQYARCHPQPRCPALPEARLLSVVQHRNRYSMALRHDLTEAADYCSLRLRESLRDLVDGLTQCQDLLRQKSSPVPSLALLHEELSSLEAEFEEVTIDLRYRFISVRTERIVLEEIDLGPFEIKLLLNRLGERSPYEVIALDPHASRRNIPHPHVQSTTLCEGDGQRTISRALEAGCLGEFFVLVRQILRTYNEQSAYESLAHWHGADCAECGDVNSDSECSTCDSCSCTLCDDCVHSCGRCERSLCYECSPSCEGCEETHCGSCLTRCEDCCERFCEDCLTDGRCAVCLEPDEGDTDAEDDPQETISVESNDEARTGAATDAAVQPDRVGQAALST